MKPIVRLLLSIIVLIAPITVAWAQNSGCGDFHASNDTAVFAGSTIRVTATGSSSGTYEWLPQSLYGAALYERPYQDVTVISDTFFVVRGFYAGSSIVTNGDFSSGNSGFTSAYTYVSSQGSQALWNEGTYAVGTNSTNYHQYFGNHTDHTGNGNFMIINGSPTANATVWQQVVNVIPQTTYVFEVFIQSLTSGTTANNPAILQFSVNNEMLYPFINASVTPGQWNEFQTQWFSSANTQATIRIVNQNTIADGNDFGLDDISFIPWLPCRDTIRVSLLTPVIVHNDQYEICQGDTLVVTPMNNDTLDAHCSSSILSVAQQPHHGTAVVAGNLLTASFDANFNGLDTIQYRLCCDTFCKTASIFVTVHPKVNITVFDTICAGNSYHQYGFDVSEASTQDGGQMKLSHSGRTAFDCDSVFNLILTITSTVTNIVQSSADAFCDNQIATLQVVSPLQDYLWSTGETTQKIEVTAAGNYSVTASSFGCEREAAFSIQPCDFSVILPNTITPGNVDGLNDYFCIPEKTQSQLLDFEIWIYNRWGELCFSSKNKNFKWNGEEKGHLHPNTLYNYIIHCSNLLGRQYNYHGSILVL